MGFIAQQRPGKYALILHTLASTTIGFIWYLIISLVLVSLHLVGLSISGTAYPQQLDDHLLTAYANFVIQPLLVFINQSVVNNVGTLILWALAGGLVATVIGACANAINDWRNTKSDVSIPQYGVVIRHPLQKNLATRFLWRIGIGVAIALYSVLALLAIRYCFANDLRILSAVNSNEIAWRFGLNLILWMLVLHGYVVLLRLYVQRTRIFGEIIY